MKPKSKVYHDKKVPGIVSSNHEHYRLEIRGNGRSGLDECVREELRLGQATTSSEIRVRGVDHQGIATGGDVAFVEIPVLLADGDVNKTGAARPLCSLFGE